jgi:replicative DNA helicase
VVIVAEQSRHTLSPGPASVTEVLAEWQALAGEGNLLDFKALPTGFTPLDELLNGGLRPGELAVLGGPYGVGKTVFGLQVARNVALADEGAKALYICYEHDRTHLLARLLCLESVEQGQRQRAYGHETADNDLTMRKLAALTGGPTGASNLFFTLRNDARYDGLFHAFRRYGDRLILVRASGSTTGLDEISEWIQAARTAGTESIFVVVDYIQKVALDRGQYRDEDESTTALMHGLKELALAQQVHLLAIAASDRASLKGQRMRFADLRGSSAMQYETDIGLVLNNKFDIVSREHLIYNRGEGEAMRNRVVLTLEKNRAGRNAVDMEYVFDAPHFRFRAKGDYVRESLIDGKVVLE